ncbi:ribbon-helix-helix domain-containing protein [Oceanihabitans sp.]|nr:ribbon-helix-helix domain-containing protein [Oceanihabitans sp.]
MAKLPTTQNTDIFIMRISPKLKSKLNELAERNKYKNASAVIRELIESEYRR